MSLIIFTLHHFSAAVNGYWPIWCRLHRVDGFSKQRVLRDVLSIALVNTLHLRQNPVLYHDILKGFYKDHRGVLDRALARDVLMSLQYDRIAMNKQSIIGLDILEKDLVIRMLT